MNKHIQKVSSILSILFLNFFMHSAEEKTLKNNTSYQKAVIINPVIDMNNSYPAPPKELPIAPGFNQYNCQRAHQGLFNELVSIIDERHNATDPNKSMVEIAFDDIDYKGDGTSTFWTYKKNILPLNEDTNLQIINSIPNPSYGSEPTIVLIWPWNNFSVGTRFKYISENEIEYGTEFIPGYIIKYYDHKNNLEIIDTIPQIDALQEYKETPDHHRDLFVSIVNQLINRVNIEYPGHAIPYVWGGSSFIHTCLSDHYWNDNNAWHRYKKNSIYHGYDCSELIVRMAKIAGIHFPWKTTPAIQAKKRALSETQKLENGDIIWIQGHVMIISDLEKNELIHARGYTSGYGSVHKACLSEVFHNVENYEQLLTMYRTDQPLTLKVKNGDVFKTWDLFKLLKLID